MKFNLTREEMHDHLKVKKAALHRKNMLHLLETQVELLKNYASHNEE